MEDNRRKFNIYVIEVIEVKNIENKGEVLFEDNRWKIFVIDSRDEFLDLRIIVSYK